LQVKGFRYQASGKVGRELRLPLAKEETMPDEPQGRKVDGDGPDPTTFEEVAEPGRKQTAADAEWLSMATADPAYFLKDSDSK
jgi:hypothetical protein